MNKSTQAAAVGWANKKQKKKVTKTKVYLYLKFRWGLAYHPPREKPMRGKPCGTKPHTGEKPKFNTACYMTGHTAQSKVPSQLGCQTIVQESVAASMKPSLVGR